MYKININVDIEKKETHVAARMLSCGFFNTLSKSFYLYENVIDELSL